LGELCLFSDDALELVAIVERDADFLTREELAAKFLRKSVFETWESKGTMSTSKTKDTNSSMREMSENWTFLKMGSRRASGKILSMSLELLFCMCVSFQHLVCFQESAYLKVDGGEEGQAGLAIDGICELFLG
jgi:hypothetical protein